MPERSRHLNGFGNTVTNRLSSMDTWALAWTAVKPMMKQLLPPIAISIARHLRDRGQPEWAYVPEGWCPTGDQGWDEPSIAAAQRRKWSDFVAAVSGTGPLAIAHEATTITKQELWAHNMLVVYAYVLARASRCRNEISVLDWGGGIGHYAVISRAFLPEVTLRYTVKDVPSLCRAGRETLPAVAFVSSDDQCLSQRYDLVFASGSLQYEHDWRTLLARFARSSRSWLYVTRLPVVERAESFVVVQRPHAYGYATEYVSWVFNRQEVLEQTARMGLTLEREFLLGERAHVIGAPEQFESRGFLFRTNGRRERSLV